MAGPFYFKWVDAGALPFDDGQHVGSDEQVMSFSLEHNEGDFPTLQIEILNPHVGLLSPGRMVWAWLVYDRNWSDQPHTPIYTPLFYGRLVSVPEDLHEETITLSFVARPEDFQEQKIVVADTKKVRPYWDPIWFDPNNLDDPDNVLESRPELWHIDRTTLQVSTSHILVGEDGTHSVGEGDVFYDSMSISYGDAPLRRVEIKGNVSWDQKARGNLDFQEIIGNAIYSFTGKSLAENWPKGGTGLSGGWRVVDGRVVRLDGAAISSYGYLGWNKATMLGGYHAVQVPEWAGQFTFSIAGGGAGAEYTAPPHLLLVPLQIVHPKLVLGFDVSRPRSEGVTIALEANVQSLLTDPGDEEVEVLSFSSSEISTPLDIVTWDDSVVYLLSPLRRKWSPRYFSTDRGEQSIEYLIALGRSHLLARARTVNIDFEIPFDLGVDLELTCRKSMFISDYRIPGGQAAGKIISYSLSCDGDSGKLVCGITIGCSIGKGGTVTGQDGDPTYVELGYVDRGYQLMLNEVLIPFGSEIAYTSVNGGPITDDGINFENLTARNVLVRYDVEGTAAEQGAAMGSRAMETGQVFQRLDAVATNLRLEIKSLEGGPFDTQYGIDTSMLMIPQTINLESIGPS